MNIDLVELLDDQVCVAANTIDSASDEANASLVNASSLLLVQKTQIDLAMLNVAGCAPQLGAATPVSNDDVPPVASVQSDGVKLGSSNDDTYMADLQQFITLLDQIHNHPDDPALALKFLTFLSTHLNNPDIMKLLKSSDLNSSVSGISIFQHMVDIAIQQAYVSSNGVEPTDFMNTLLTMFSGSDDISQSLQSEIQYWQLSSNWDKTNPDSFAGEMSQIPTQNWDIYLTGSWGNSLGDYNILGWEATARVSGVDFLIANSPNALVQAIIFLSMLSDGSSCDQISGYGGTASWLKNRTDELTNLQNEFADGFTNETDAKSFIEQLNQLKVEIDNSPLVDSDFKQMMDSNIDGILNTQVQVGTDPTNTKSLQDWYNSDVNSPDPTSHDLLTALNNIFPNPNNTTTPVPPQYSAIIQNLKSGATDVSDQSQTQTTLLSQLTANQQVIDNNFNKTLLGDSGISSLISVCVKNQPGS